MTQLKSNARESYLKELLASDRDFFKELLAPLIQELLEAEMTESLKAAKSEQTEDRVGYRSGYYNRRLITRVGEFELRIPQDREGLFSTRIFERYQRSEKALVSALMQMYINGVSTRKVKRITEALCGHSFSAAVVSRINKKLDRDLINFARRELSGSYHYLYLDATYQKVRISGIVRSCAVLVAIGVDQSGRRAVLGIELADRESLNSWNEFVLGLKERGLSGVRFVISDDHVGIKEAVNRLLPQAVWQRCYVHFLRNCREHLPPKEGTGCREQLRWIYESGSLSAAKEALSSWLGRWQGSYPGFCNWVEENIEETFSFFSVPMDHRVHVRSSNVLERFNQELRRRSRVVRIFPDEASLLRLNRALAVEIHEDWMEGGRFLNMELLKIDSQQDMIKQNQRAETENRSLIVNTERKIMNQFCRTLQT